MFLILYFVVYKKVLKISQTKDTHVAVLQTRFGLEGQLVLPKKANHAELIKTVAENLDSKAPSVATILVYLETTA